MGFQLFDTAQSYGNEEGVGYTLKNTLNRVLKLEELFITAKFFKANASKEKVQKSYEESCKKLGIDYADLFLIHQSVNDTYAAYRGMIKLYNAKKVRAIGVSNFDNARLMDFVQNQAIKPAVNQVECHPYFQQIEAQKFMQELDVQMEAWSPLKQARDNILQDKTLLNIGKKHNKSATQVISRYIVQRGIVTIAASKKIAHMRENFGIFDFTLSAQDMAKIAKLDTPTKMLDHNNPATIKWLNEREIGQSLKR